MKTCYTCKHLYRCRLDYDRIYPCKEYDDGKIKEKAPPAGSGTDESTAHRPAGGHEDKAVWDGELL